MPPRKRQTKAAAAKKKAKAKSKDLAADAVEDGTREIVEQEVVSTSTEPVPVEIIGQEQQGGQRENGVVKQNDVGNEQRSSEEPKDVEENLYGNGGGQTVTMEERKKKLDELRNRMRDSTRQNRTALLTESTKAKTTARETARREKQLRLAETLRIRAEAEERGEDVERSRNWEWTVEENEEWEKKKRRKERNADFEFRDEEQQARKRYKKDLAFLKPDLEAYNKHKQLALGATPGASSSNASGSSALTTFDPSGGAVATYEQQRAAESLYRDANTLLYADNKPSEDAIDKVVEKLNLEQDKRNKFSRKRLNEDEGDITYINERNRVFNKKIARFYDKYTTEIRASFERGTAL